VIQVVAAAIVRTGEVLAARRSHPPQAAGRWEFPGGKVHAGETPEAALIREIAEELGCGIAVEAWLASPALSPESRIDLRVAACRLTSGTPIAHEHEALRWLAPEALGTLDWLEPDRPFLPELRKLLLDR
jgi:8-oxo-dGTP diphosphatase